MQFLPHNLDTQNHTNTCPVSSILSFQFSWRVRVTNYTHSVTYFLNDFSIFCLWYFLFILLLLMFLFSRMNISDIFDHLPTQKETPTLFSWIPTGSRSWYTPLQKLLDIVLTWVRRLWFLIPSLSFCESERVMGWPPPPLPKQPLNLKRQPVY